MHIVGTQYIVVILAYHPIVYDFFLRKQYFLNPFDSTRIWSKSSLLTIIFLINYNASYKVDAWSVSIK